MPAMPSLPAQVSLAAIDHEILARWRRSQTFQESLRQTEGRPRWTFYEGPPTANGMPGIHHVEARVFKDMFCRFKTMQGFHVQRKAGWDCHGLPVEVAVEKELGLSGKRDIETYGVAAFNERCRESVLRHVDAFTALTERMGYWIELSDAYRTMDSSYVESVWWALKTIYDKGLLVQDFRISPYCPRCGTALSDHEMGQPDVYREVTDPSVTVRFPVTEAGADSPPAVRRHLPGADLLVWTTTPWTLVANTAVAVHPDVTYVIARRVGGFRPRGYGAGAAEGHHVPPGKQARDGDKVVIAESLFARVLGEGWHILADFPGAALTGARYSRPFDFVDIPDAHVVVGADFVTTADGTGLVHLAPAFGADDMAIARAHGLPVVNPVRPDGRFEEQLPLVGGLFFKDADQPVTADLAERDLLLRSAPHTHPYPHCWRCGTALLYYALPSWYIRTTAIKDELLAENDQTSWQPATVKNGRYGEWLRGNVDWALSRTRYWGTPLPLWECSDGHRTCVGSLAELGELASVDVSGLDPHRPFVDSVTFACPECGLTASRVPEVIDAWFDSGAMPFAQHGAPLRNVEEFERAYPAQFICEAIDQTRGWFYSLMAVGTLVFGRSAYQTVVCLGHVVDATGRKMSKHLGNVMEPMGVLNSHGADAVRWFFAAAGSPWGQRRIGPGALDEIVSGVLLTYWNLASFLTLYANASSPAWTPRQPAPAQAQRPLLDRWLLGEVGRCVRDVTTAMEEFDSAAAGRRIAALIGDLSNWYVRRSRRRFWEGAATPDGAAAFATLHEALVTVTKLMAPVTPFVTDYVWTAIRPAGDPASVHLAAWPVSPAGLPWPADETRAREAPADETRAREALADEALAAQMALVRRLVDLGRSARASGGTGTRQPLSRAVVAAPGFGELPAELLGLVAAELNVHSVEPLDSADLSGAGASQGAALLVYQVKPDFRALGARFGSETQAVAQALSSADPAQVAGAVADGGSFQAEVPGRGPVDLTAADMIVTQAPASGWSVAVAGADTVALDLEVTPSLRAEGLAREVIRRIQQARKADGLAVTDRITVRWQAPGQELASALAGHGPMIAGEVLAEAFEPCEGDPGAAPGHAEAGATGDPGDWHEHVDELLGLRFWLAVARP
jgi:isoleucyl-tRNA synthetase